MTPPIYKIMMLIRVGLGVHCTVHLCGFISLSCYVTHVDVKQLHEWYWFYQAGSRISNQPIEICVLLIKKKKMHLVGF